MTSAREPALDTIDVTGLASQPFEADQVKWSVQLGRRTAEAALADGCARIHQDVEGVVTRLVKVGGVLWAQAGVYNTSSRKNEIRVTEPARSSVE